MVENGNKPKKKVKNRHHPTTQTEHKCKLPRRFINVCSDI